MRDDFFTGIHKALRVGLFAATTRTGSTDWSDPAEVAATGAAWAQMLGLLRDHARHEDEILYPILEAHEPGSTGKLVTEHDALEHELDALARRFGAVLADPDEDGGLDLYRALGAFVGRYLGHILSEETAVMPAIWSHLDDDELAEVRARLMAAIPPPVMVATQELMMQALSFPELVEVMSRIRSVAPDGVAEGILTRAGELRGDAFAAALRSATVLQPEGSSR